MNSKELAKLLNGRQYRREITKEESLIAAASGLVVIYGYSDDNIELNGAITDEVGMWKGGLLFINKKDLSVSKIRGRVQTNTPLSDDETIVINVGWYKPGTDHSWHLSTDAPHECFDILDDDEKFCRGLVIQILTPPVNSDTIALLVSIQEGLSSAQKHLQMANEGFIKLYESLNKGGSHG